MLMLVLEKKMKHMKEGIRMKKGRDGEYKREDIDKKWGRFFQILREISKEIFQILRENSKERYIVRNVAKKPYE